ncbi:hypothetical protein N7448_003818 [Penicillium atrosanguineum]|uniref:TauD/TfdA-like domain-containing protein n=1 Tax=Penicillium atrosanguineum TaxID=1132637 RepID=A0A9W9H802_9EURO|nr:uncharacterized protein N7443_002786 [Penicillium atrosanguineum]KAJ5122685.1 hypothetical protein N7526_009622 [Penicillium atrosanguineum]KAJ5140410.1 hypothetical protein N7448_003818 [Penicillium atrosanguineum]KAJ5310325.1 hypothetical protein N7443_002786 [Penicillium atrosanguineum]KAJ5315842.1 hypothetical protein N7476_006149 [Penicillium atrosanguineum]
MSRIKSLCKDSRHFEEVPVLEARSVDSSHQDDHFNAIQAHLKSAAVVKIKLGFEDDDCRYLEQVILNLNQRHGHGLPIDHSASRGWFWDIRPMAKSPEALHQARSETANHFPWHTDCSYESSPPRYFGLQVLEPDCCGGGTLSILKVEKIVAHLSESSRSALCQSEFSINVPPEFIKAENDGQIVGSILSIDDGEWVMRFREDIFTPLTEAAASALAELKDVLSGPAIEAEILHLTPESMPRGSLIIVGNRQWLHARNAVKDPNRHLRRVRWDAQPFGSAPLTTIS